MSQPITPSTQVPDRAAYFAWLSERFPGDEIDYHPPIGPFLDSPALRNAWTSYVPEGRGPLDQRVDVYLRRDWRGDPGTLCVGNVGAAGTAASRSWDEVTEALVVEAIADVEARAAAAGYARLCMTGAGPELRDLCLARGYVPREDAPDELVRALG